MTKRRPSAFYHFFIILPNWFYPFANEVDGQLVRGVRSADVELKRAVRRYGVGAYGYKFATYRQIFHLTGSLIVIYGATVLALWLFNNSSAALIAVLSIVTALVTYQEFFYQRHHYRQHWQKRSLIG